MSRKSRKNVGVIGLGIIGTRVAAGLRAAGYQVYVWNRSAKPAPNFLGSPAEVAEAAETIQLFVSDAAALFEIIEAMGDSLTARHVIICSATVGPEAVLEAAQLVEGKGAQFLDAPFTGSKLAAEKRQLVYYIGGAEHTYLKVKPVLEVTSKAIVRIGEVGHAATVKVVTNMISAVTTQVLAEALSIVQKAGLEPEVLAAAIEQNACRSGVIDLKLPKMIAGDYDPHFSLKHMFKDVQLGIHMANALDIEIPATTVTAGVMYGALNQGWADLDFSVLYQNYVSSESRDVLPALPLGELAIVHSPGTLEVTEGGPDQPDNAENEGSPAFGENPREGDSFSAPSDRDLAEGSDSSPSGDGDDSKVNESVPTEEAARMIEAVVSHSGSDRENADRSANPDVESFGQDRPAPENGAEEKGGSTGDDAPASSPQAATDAPAGEGNESASRANNFVKRWFVARTGG